jgi:5-formyltetrahydrofolate cyclo-ligase
VKDFLIGEKKQRLRKLFLKKRNKFSPKERAKKSLLIFERLKRLEVFKKAKTVMFYFTYGSEVMTEKMIQFALSKKKTAVLPVCDTQKCAISAARVSDTEKGIKPGAYGISEPLSVKRNVVKTGLIDLVIVPGVVFDLKGHRLGYGKGYYDKWLKHFRLSQRVGLAFENSLIKCLPITKSDTPVGLIVTEKRAIRTR